MWDQYMDPQTSSGSDDEDNVKLMSLIRFADDSLFQTDDSPDETEDDRENEEVHLLPIQLSLEEGELLSPLHEEVYEKDLAINLNPEVEIPTLVYFKEDEKLSKNENTCTKDVAIKPPEIISLDNVQSTLPEDTNNQNLVIHFSPEVERPILIPLKKDGTLSSIEKTHEKDVVIKPLEIISFDNVQSPLPEYTPERDSSIHLSPQVEIPTLIPLKEDGILSNIEETNKNTAIKPPEITSHENLSSPLPEDTPERDLVILEEEIPILIPLKEDVSPSEETHNNDVANVNSPEIIVLEEEGLSSLHDENHENNLAIYSKPPEKIPEVIEIEENSLSSQSLVSQENERLEEELLALIADAKNKKTSEYKMKKKAKIDKIKKNLRKHKKTSRSSSIDSIELLQETFNVSSTYYDYETSPQCHSRRMSRSPEMRSICYRSSSSSSYESRSPKRNKYESHRYESPIRLTHRKKYKKHRSCSRSTYESYRPKKKPSLPNDLRKVESHCSRRCESPYRLTLRSRYRSRSYSRSPHKSCRYAKSRYAYCDRSSYSSSSSPSPRHCRPDRYLSRNKNSLVMKERDCRKTKNMVKLSHIDEMSKSVTKKIHKSHRYNPYERSCKRVKSSPESSVSSSPSDYIQSKSSYVNRPKLSKPSTESTAFPIKTEYVEDLRLKINRKQAQNESEIEEVGQKNVGVEKESKAIVKKEEAADTKKGFNNYYCSECQISLRSEVTWQTHILGRKHNKVIKSKTVHEVSKGLLAIATTSSFASEETPRFGYPAAGKIHVPSSETPKLQPTIDECSRKYPLIGLEFVKEIQAPFEVTYYCGLCDSPCSMHSIMPHLIGIKHQLHCVKKIYPDYYEKIKNLSRSVGYEKKIKRILMMHEQRFGRRRIKVFKERDARESSSNANAFGLTWRNPVIKSEKDDDIKPEIRPNDECLDTSKADFYCKLCDAHMNNVEMWESHVKGRRHLQNMKKSPLDNIKAKTSKAPHVPSVLEKIIEEEASDELIVGLGFIRETQGQNGTMYTCFLCGACCTNYDILDHLMLTKHRSKFLEKLDADGKENGFHLIRNLDIQDDTFRNSLIEEQCREMLKKYGKGHVEVYVS